MYQSWLLGHEGHASKWSWMPPQWLSRRKKQKILIEYKPPIQKREYKDKASTQRPRLLDQSVLMFLAYDFYSSKLVSSFGQQHNIPEFILSVTVLPCRLKSQESFSFLILGDDFPSQMDFPAQFFWYITHCHESSPWLSLAIPTTSSGRLCVHYCCSCFCVTIQVIKCSCTANYSWLL